MYVKLHVCLHVAQTCYVCICMYVMYVYIYMTCMYQLGPFKKNPQLRDTYLPRHDM